MKPGDDLAIDALAGFLPMAARDRLAETLTPAEIDTLAHLAKTGTGPNSLRALASDLAYLEAWARASTDAPLVWPATETTVLRFIAHHLWDEEEREKNPEHGMPEAVAEALRAEGRLKSTGPHAPATVRRRLALWSSLHRWRGLEGPFGNPSIRNALRLAIRAADRPRGRKSASAITRDVLDQLLATCGRGRAVDLRDRALLLLAFGSGGRRRSEIARLKVDDLEEREPVRRRPCSAEWREASGFGDPAAAHENRVGRRRRERARRRPAGRSSARLARLFENRRRPGVSAHRQMGKHRRRRARSAERERHDQKPLRRRRTRSGGILGAWAAFRLSDRSRARRRAAPRGHAAVAASLRPAGRAVLQ